MKLIDFLHSTRTQAYLAFVIIIGGGCVIAFCKLPDNDRNRLWDIIMLTAAFYFGSSKSGATKDETIANMVNNQQVPVVTDSTIQTVNSNK